MPPVYNEVTRPPLFLRPRPLVASNWAPSVDLSLELTQALVRKLAPLTGQSYYDALSRELALLFDLDVCLVGRKSADGKRVQILSHYSALDVALGATYELEGTPCASVLAHGEISIIEESVVEKFPHDQLLQDLSVESYFGVPILSQQGIQPIGLIAGLKQKSFKAVPSFRWLVDVLAVRVAAEIERETREREMRELQEMLERQKNFLHTVLDQIPSAIYVKDISGKHYYGNRAFLEVVGPTNKDYHEITAEEMFEDPKAVAEIAKCDRFVFENKRHLIREEVLPVRGQTRTFLTHKFPIFTRDGEVESLCGISTDISQHKAIESRLQENLEYRKALLRSSPDTLLLIGRDLVIEEAYSAERLHPDFKNGFVEGLSLHQTLTPAIEAKFIRACEQLKSRGHADAFEFSFPRTNGTGQFEGRVSGPVGDRHLFSIRDITASRKLEVQMITSSRLAALGEMAAGLAHELNNPLFVILAYAQQLQTLVESEERDLNEVHRHVEKISSTVFRISRIIKSLRAFGRDASAEPIQKMRLKTVLDETLEFCQARFRSHGVDLILPEKNIDIEFECRPTQISQVLLNVLNNAFDAVQERDEKWVKVEIFADSQFTKIAISDSGAGIPEAIRGKIMQPFFTTKEVGKGTGLGLSISKGLIEQNGGSLELDMDSPVTRFVITLPMHPPKTTRT